ncbi:hypothetical protein GCM10008934_20260 [Virgibacillus salarius]
MDDIYSSQREYYIDKNLAHNYDNPTHQTIMGTAMKRGLSPPSIYSMDNYI